MTDTTLDTNEVSVNHISFIEEGLASFTGRKVRAFVEADEVNHVQPADHLVEAVKRYARDNYEAGKCWDHVVEWLSDAEIAGYIGHARTENGAIWAVWNKFTRNLWQARIGQEFN